MSTFARLVVVAVLAAAGCSKASPADRPDGPGGDDEPDARPIDAAPRFDALPDATGGGTPDAMVTPVTATLNQTTSATMTTGSIACTYPFNVTAENSYYRAFTLTEHGIANRAFTVNQVSFGVESAVGDDGFFPPLTMQPATVRLHTYTGTVGTTLDPAQLTQVATLGITINNAGSPITLAFPMTATIPANGIVVLELAIPDGDVDGDTFGPVFFVGSNSAGETRSSYLRAPGCGANSPTTIASLGFANRHVVMTVTGTHLP